MKKVANNFGVRTFELIAKLQLMHLEFSFSKYIFLGLASISNPQASTTLKSVKHEEFFEPKLIVQI